MNRVISARCPANIALVKYWGKHGRQLPCNASLSMTLSEAYTEVTLECTEKQDAGIAFSYYFEGAPREDFRERVLRYMQGQKEFSGLLDRFALRMESRNSFPHSAGIASSASAFAAVAAALLEAAGTAEGHDFRREGSRLARLGSGSACRSFYGPYALWGQLDGVSWSGDDYAVPVKEIHPDFRSMQDAILIVEPAPKKISSSAGHALMNGHPFASARFQQANGNCLRMLDILRTGDLEAFISLTEREALSLHAMMMTSEDYYLLFRPGTIHVIEQVFQFRKDTGLPLCFTLDAGPNVHLLYPDFIRKEVRSFLKDNLQHSLSAVIYDQAGPGGAVIE